MEVEQLKRIIKNNLVSYNLTGNQIEEIVEQLSSDIIEAIANEES